MEPDFADNKKLQRFFATANVPRKRLKVALDFLRSASDDSRKLFMAEYGPTVFSVIVSTIGQFDQVVKSSDSLFKIVSTKNANAEDWTELFDLMDIMLISNEDKIAKGWQNNGLLVVLAKLGSPGHLQYIRERTLRSLLLYSDAIRLASPEGPHIQFLANYVDYTPFVTDRTTKLPFRPKTESSETLTRGDAPTEKDSVQLLRMILDFSIMNVRPSEGREGERSVEDDERFAYWGGILMHYFMPLFYPVAAKVVKLTTESGIGFYNLCPPAIQKELSRWFTRCRDSQGKVDILWSSQQYAAIMMDMLRQRMEMTDVEILGDTLYMYRQWCHGSLPRPARMLDNMESMYMMMMMTVSTVFVNKAAPLSLIRASISLLEALSRCSMKSETSDRLRATVLAIIDHTYRSIDSPIYVETQHEFVMLMLYTWMRSPDRSQHQVWSQLAQAVKGWLTWPCANNLGFQILLCWREELLRLTAIMMNKIQPGVYNHRIAALKFFAVDELLAAGTGTRGRAEREREPLPEGMSMEEAILSDEIAAARTPPSRIFSRMLNAARSGPPDARDEEGRQQTPGKFSMLSPKDSSSPGTPAGGDTVKEYLQQLEKIALSLRAYTTEEVFILFDRLLHIVPPTTLGSLDPKLHALVIRSLLDVARFWIEDGIAPEAKGSDHARAVQGGPLQKVNPSTIIAILSPWVLPTCERMDEEFLNSRLAAVETLLRLSLVQTDTVLRSDHLLRLTSVLYGALSSNKTELWVTVVRHSQDLFLREVPGLNFLIAPFAHVLGEMLNPTFESKHPVGKNSTMAALKSLLSLIPFPNRYAGREYGSWSAFFENEAIVSSTTLSKELRQMVLQTKQRPQLKEFMGKTLARSLEIPSATLEMKCMSLWGLYFLMADELSARDDSIKMPHNETPGDRLELTLFQEWMELFCSLLNRLDDMGEVAIEILKCLSEYHVLLQKKDSRLRPFIILSLADGVRYQVETALREIKSDLDSISAGRPLSTASSRPPSAPEGGVGEGGASLPFRSVERLSNRIVQLFDALSTWIMVDTSSVFKEPDTARAVFYAVECAMSGQIPGGKWQERMTGTRQKSVLEFGLELRERLSGDRRTPQLDNLRPMAETAEAFLHFIINQYHNFPRSASSAKIHSSMTEFTDGKYDGGAGDRAQLVMRDVTGTYSWEIQPLTFVEKEILENINSRGRRGSLFDSESGEEVIPPSQGGGNSLLEVLTEDFPTEEAYEENELGVEVEPRAKRVMMGQVGEYVALLSLEMVVSAALRGLKDGSSIGSPRPPRTPPQSRTTQLKDLSMDDERRGRSQARQAMGPKGPGAKEQLKIQHSPNLAQNAQRERTRASSLSQAKRVMEYNSPDNSPEFKSAKSEMPLTPTRENLTSSLNAGKTSPRRRSLKSYKSEGNLMDSLANASADGLKLEILRADQIEGGRRVQLSRAVDDEEEIRARISSEANTPVSVLGLFSVSKTEDGVGAMEGERDILSLTLKHIHQRFPDCKMDSKDATLLGGSFTVGQEHDAQKPQTRKSPSRSASEFYIEQFLASTGPIFMERVLNDKEVSHGLFGYLQTFRAEGLLPFCQQVNALNRAEKDDDEKRIASQIIDVFLLPGKFHHTSYPHLNQELLARMKATELDENKEAQADGKTTADRKVTDRADLRDKETENDDLGRKKGIRNDFCHWSKELFNQLKLDALQLIESTYMPGFMKSSLCPSQLKLYHELVQMESTGIQFNRMAREFFQQHPVAKSALSFPAQRGAVNALDMCRMLVAHLGIFPPIKSRNLRLLDSKDDKLVRSLKNLDQSPARETVKIGVVYVGKGQHEQSEILQNTSGSRDYEEFLKSLGWEVDLGTHDGFSGGLDTNAGSLANGKKSIYYATALVEVMFHVVTMMKTKPGDTKQIDKKRHVGNDFVTIIWSDDDRPYNPETISSKFNEVRIIIYPLKKYHNGLYRIEIVTKSELRSFGPLMDGMVVGRNLLGTFVRQTAISANRVCRRKAAVYLPPFPTRKRLIDEIMDRYSSPYGDNKFFCELFDLPPEEDNRRLGGATESSGLVNNAVTHL